MNLRRLCFRLVPSFACVLFCAQAAVENRASPAPADGQFVPASDARFFYEGCFDSNDPARPVVIWEGSRISVDFTGPLLVLNFVSPSEQNFFDVTVDGETLVVGLAAVAPTVDPGQGTWMVTPRGSDPVLRFVWPRTLGPGRHSVEVYKRSEASAGHVAFVGVQLAAAASVLKPAERDYRFRLQFIGDSITAGACNEDGSTDQWESRRTHNFALSYAAVVAKSLRADLHCMAVSGMGITPAWADVTVSQVWDRAYPRPDAPRVNLAAWLPDVVCINLGENDDSFGRSHGHPFPAGYRPGLVAFVRSVRAAWPNAHIVLLRGGMYGGAKSDELRDAWTAAVKELETGDAAISHFVFSHWSGNHPRVADDRAMAGELVAWLGQQPFMRGRL